MPMMAAATTTGCHAWPRVNTAAAMHAAANATVLAIDSVERKGEMRDSSRTSAADKPLVIVVPGKRHERLFQQRRQRAPLGRSQPAEHVVLGRGQRLHQRLRL